MNKESLSSQSIREGIQTGRCVANLETGVVFNRLGVPLTTRLDRRGYLVCRLYSAASKRRVQTHVHLVIAYAAFGEQVFQPGIHVHHANRNKLDNRSENLILIDHREHGRLHGKESINAYKRVDPQKAVHMDSADGRWRFSLTRHFNNRELAVEVYKRTVEFIDKLINEAQS